MIKVRRSMNILQCGSDSENSKCFGLKMRIIRQRTALTHSTIFTLFIFSNHNSNRAGRFCATYDTCSTTIWLCNSHLSVGVEQIVWRGAWGGTLWV